MSTPPDDHETEGYDLELLRDPDLDRVCIVQEWDGGDVCTVIMSADDAEWLAKRILRIESVICTASVNENN